MRHTALCVGRSINLLLVVLLVPLLGRTLISGEPDSIPATKLQPAVKAESKAESVSQRKQWLTEDQTAAQSSAIGNLVHPDPAWLPSHVQAGAIRVSPEHKYDFIHTFCLDADGNLLVGCGGTRDEPERKQGKVAIHKGTDPCELRLYTPEGRLLKTIKLESEPQAVCTLPDGTIFVGGAGKLLKLDSDGKQVAQARMPSLQANVPAGGREFATARERDRTVVTGLAVTDTEVFVASLGGNGRGYSVWRLDHDFQNPKEIITGLTGRDGQMDIQAAGGDLWIAENGQYRVCRYDRDGKKLSDFGKHDPLAADGFGGRCEPKNLAIGPGGDIFTAESGVPVVVKRFSPEGKFRGVVAIQYNTVCVHVSVAAAQDGRVYILNSGEGAIHVFGDRKKIPTHQFVRTMGVQGDSTTPVQLNSFCLDAGGNVLAACSGKNGGDLRVVGSEGNLLKTLPLDFVPQAVNRAADGSIYAAGSGKMAHLDASGKLLKEEKLPTDFKPLSPEEEQKLREELKKLQADNAKLFADYSKQQMDYIHAQQELTEAETDADAAVTDAEKKATRELVEKLKAARTEAQSKFMAKGPEVAKASQAMQSIYAKIGTGARGTVTGIAATKQDLFVCRQPDAGYGYEVWRTDHDFTHAKKIITGLAGCCGQMDVQADGDELWIPENGRHQVHRYDRDGNKLATFGKNDRSAPDGFGGCCEPKNIRISGDEIFTAESTQPVQIKHFGKDGRFLGIVAVPTYKTGCVRVCVEVSPDRQQVYCVSPGENAIYVFKQGEPGETMVAVKPVSIDAAAAACKDGKCADNCKDDKCKDEKPKDDQPKENKP